MNPAGDMRIVFLDIDGVLNTDRAARMNQDPNRLDFDRAALEQLKRIIVETGDTTVGYGRIEYDDRENAA